MNRKVVIDASVSASWFLQDEFNQKADELLKEVIHGRIDLFQPVLWKYEIINVLRTAIMHKRIAKDKAMLAVSTINSIRVEYIVPGNEDMINLMRIADENSLTAYDASYLHTAEMKTGELFTSDKDLLKLKNKYPFVRKIDEFTVKYN
jgi:predicted nucleic acid-binding protein